MTTLFHNLYHDAPFSRHWAMPSPHTFQIPPIRRFLHRWLRGVSVDPFAGQSTIATHRNDLLDGLDAADFCRSLLASGITADTILYDPPYSPRQIREVYQSRGLLPPNPNAAYFAQYRQPLADLLKPGGVALSFGWNSAGFGARWPILEIVLIYHGGKHNDTLCLAQRKPF